MSGRETIPNLSPMDFKVGDRLRLPSGPYRGHIVEITATLGIGRHSTYGFKAKILGDVSLNLDYTDRISVLREAHDA